jgi:hypothetical protein
MAVAERANIDPLSDPLSNFPNALWEKFLVCPYYWDIILSFELLLMSPAPSSRMLSASCTLVNNTLMTWLGITSSLGPSSLSPLYISSDLLIRSSFEDIIKIIFYIA